MDNNKFDIGDILVKKDAAHYANAPDMIMIAKISEEKVHLVIDLEDGEVLKPTPGVINRIYRKVA